MYLSITNSDYRIILITVITNKVISYNVKII